MKTIFIVVCRAVRKIIIVWWKLRIQPAVQEGSTFALCIRLHGEIVSETAAAAVARILSFYLSFVFPSSLSLPLTSVGRPCVRPTDRPRAPRAKLPPLPPRDLRNCATRSAAWSPGRIITQQAFILHCPLLSLAPPVETMDSFVWCGNWKRWLSPLISLRRDLCD